MSGYDIVLPRNESEFTENKDHSLIVDGVIFISGCRRERAQASLSSSTVSSCLPTRKTTVVRSSGTKSVLLSHVDHCGSSECVPACLVPRSCHLSNTYEHV